MATFLCIGDYIALYCEDTDGYVISQYTSAVHNGLNVYHKQVRDKPDNIPDPQVVTFQVGIQNRYKLNKKYRKHYSTVDDTAEVIDEADAELKAHAEQARTAAEAENVDNLAEQKRNQGKRVRYGEIIQLKHVFTNKFVHVNTTQTSQKDKNNMLLSLHVYNAKNAQFRIIPRYKVKSEGEFVQILDQISLESIKSPGHFFHASLPYQVDNFFHGSELNLGVDQSGFTIVRCHGALAEIEAVVREEYQYKKPENVLGGQFVQLFHKELEAYIVAEGLFNDVTTEDVHLRIREVDQLDARTLCPSSSAVTYWQIESEGSILHGEPLQWSQQFKFRHATTRMYLIIDEDINVAMTRDAMNPRTVFKLHPVLQEVEEVTFESYARIEHVISGSWLHALKDQEYERREFADTEDERSMKALRWDGGELRQMTSSDDRRYDDAYTIQKVDLDRVNNFNFAAGMVPFIQDFIKERESGKHLQAKDTHRLCQALREMRDFMLIKGKPIKARQKLLRNLRVVDLLVRVVQFPLRGMSDENNLTKVFKEVYDIIYTYMIGSSRKNALYFAKYISFFQTQMIDSSELALKICQMVVELIRDNRKIVDRISRSQIDTIVDRVRHHQNYRYLELLEVLCVCCNVAIADNQTYIAQKWLLEDQRGVYLTERGQNIHMKPNHVYVSTDQMETWAPLNDFVDELKPGYDDDANLFFRKQLDLFNALCYGRNEYCVKLITKDLSYLSWEEAFLCLQSTIIPDDIRAKYCELIIGMFVNVGNNYSVVDYPQLCFVYEYVGTKDFEKSASADQYAAKDLVTIFPVLRDWISEFLDNNRGMIASNIAHNMLIEQVLRLLHFLVKFGYYDDVEEVLPPLTILLDGSLDVPFEPDKGKDFSKEKKKIVANYKAGERYEQSPETAAIVKAKFASLMVLDLVMTFQGNARLGEFIKKFKECEGSEMSSRKSNQHVLCPALHDDFQAHSTKASDMRKQRSMLRDLKNVFEASCPSDLDHLTRILIDLAHYKYDDMNNLSLNVLCKVYSIKTNMFNMAINALVLITTDSCRVHREVAKQVPLIRMMAKSKWTDDQVQRMETMLSELIAFCHLPKTPEEPHTMNQRLLISHNVLGVVFEILEAETDVQLADSYSQIEKVLRKAVQLLRALTLQYQDVQVQVFANLDSLLKVRLVEADLALAIKEAFVQNQDVCLKITPKQIQRIVNLAAENQERAPEMLDLLNAIVKVEGLNLALKRNQTLVMKYIMQSYSKVAYILEQSIETRVSVLLGEKGADHLQYLISLVDLIATCAEGENRYIESLCQTILSVEEILQILNNESIENQLKKPFLRYLLFAYLKTSTSAIESGAADLLHDRCWTAIWKFIQTITEEMDCLSVYLKKAETETVYYLMCRPFPKNGELKIKEAEYRAHGSLHYIFDGVLPFIQIFAGTFFTPDSEDYKEEVDMFDDLVTSVTNFCTLIAPILVNPDHLKLIISTITQLIPKSNHPMSMMETVVNNIGKGKKLNDTVSEIKAGNKEYYAAEIELNTELKTFSVNCSLLNGGHNTVAAQLKTSSKREYTTIGGDEALPLGGEFQDIVSCFIDTSSHRKTDLRYKPADLLIRQLAVSARNSGNEQSANARKDQEMLDIRSLQILRAMIHNEERKLPEDWELRCTERNVRKGLRIIQEIQCVLNHYQVCTMILPHLASPNDNIVKEVLSLQAIMLFNANVVVQGSLLKYFLETQQEVFFYAVRARLQMSTSNIKERRLLQTQQRLRKEEAGEQAENMRSTLTLGMKAMKQIQYYEMMHRAEQAAQQFTKRVSLSAMQSKTMKKPKKKDKKEKKAILEPPSPQKSNNHVSINGEVQDKDSHGFENPLYAETDLEMEKSPLNDDFDEFDEDMDYSEDEEEEADEEVSMRDDGYIELVLKLLARVCDGQHQGLQNYLREQPDNIKSFNIVAEVSQFINVVYSNVNKDTIGLVTQLFSSINEFCAGSQDNRATVYDNKIIDYINFILRAGDFEGCEIEEVLELRQTLANLLITMIEENDPDALQIAREVKDTLDKEAIYRVMAESYQMYIDDQKKSKGIMKLFKSSTNKELMDANTEVGFTFYMIMARLYDIDPTMGKKELAITELQQKAYKFYKKNSNTIEILKGDHLQKVHFRVKNKNLLREEIKEKLKWSVDRSSPSNKIRDFMEWSNAILDDINYQRRVLSNPIAVFLTKFWLLWNHGATMLSVALNCFMLIGLKAPFAMNGTNVNKSEPFPPAISNTTAEWMDGMEGIHHAMGIVGIVHNVLCLIVVVTFFIANHPKLPDFVGFFTTIMSYIKPKDKDDDEDLDADVASTKLGVSLFSFVSFYYIAFLGCSLAGQWYSPYFFAFHLVNIVNNNQLLQGVIQAVTQNGLSLIWVSILGIVIMYLYTIIGFTMFRSAFNPESFMYADTLFHCFICVLRFGLIGDLFENIAPHESEATFSRFSIMTVYNVTFFILITTIGLNIIFGIIVDTFSELRDLKWQAESDMRDTCFICSRNSYDFEHHGEGFDYHVRYEHNMWAYIFFFIHLRDTKSTDYTSLELHVDAQLKEKKYDFFPLNRALCLSSKDEDSTDSKIDDLLNNVKELVRRQKEEETEKKKWLETLRQKKWQQRHRTGFDESDADVVEDHGNLPMLRAGDGNRSRKTSCAERSQDSDYALGLSEVDLTVDSHPASGVAPVDYPSHDDPMQFLDDYPDDLQSIDVHRGIELPKSEDEDEQDEDHLEDEDDEESEGETGSESDEGSNDE